MIGVVLLAFGVAFAAHGVYEVRDGDWLLGYVLLGLGGGLLGWFVSWQDHR